MLEPEWIPSGELSYIAPQQNLSKYNRKRFVQCIFRLLIEHDLSGTCFQSARTVQRKFVAGAPKPVAPLHFSRNVTVPAILRTQ